MNLQEMIQKYIKSGYTDEFASSKLSQDLILTAIANSKYSQNITIKGGVVMHNLSNDKRRATHADHQSVHVVPYPYPYSPRAYGEPTSLQFV